MSAGSLAPRATPEAAAQPTPKGWGVFSGTWWATVAFLGPQFAVAPLLPLFAGLSLTQNTKLFVLQALVQTLTVVMIGLVIAAYRLNLRSIGLRRLQWRDIGWAAMIFPVYLVVATAAVTVLGIISPEAVEEVQELGFDAPQGIELLLVFLALVVVAPIVEEVIFRGFMFRAYHRTFGAILGAILVSGLFGLAHGQLNVGLDTFILSLFLCYVRLKTDGLWAPIFLHAIKNFVAFSILFIIGSK